MFARQCYRLRPGSGLSDDSHVWLPVNDAEETKANYRVIIGDEHSNDAGFENFLAGVRTRRIGSGRLHDLQEQQLLACERLYTKRPGIVICRLGTICEHLWLGQPCAQCTSR